MRPVNGSELFSPFGYIWVGFLFLSLIPGLLYILKLISGTLPHGEVSRGRELTGWLFFFIPWSLSAVSVYLLTEMHCLPTGKGGYWCRMTSWNALDDYRIIDGHLVFVVMVVLGFCFALSPPKELKYFGASVFLLSIVALGCIAGMT